MPDETTGGRASAAPQFKALSGISPPHVKAGLKPCQGGLA
jgi:hypothetical protein